MEVSCVKFVRQYKMSHGHHHLQLEHRGVSQIRRVFQFGQLQVCCDNHESAATIAAFNDEKHLLNSIFGTMDADLKAQAEALFTELKYTV